MSDHCEEQEMEQEALEAIYMEDFEALNGTQPFKWAISLVPHNDEGSDEANHVALRLLVDVPLDYPDVKPTLNLELVKGLAEEQKDEILGVADQELEANMGMPAIYSVCEGIRAWLLDNNKEYDGSMYAQMMRKQEAASKAKEENTVQYESHNVNKTKIPTQAELEEAAVYKRRQEGTPCNRENFEIWKAKFEAEMEEKAQANEMEDATSKKKKDKSNNKGEDVESKPTGYEIFGSKGGVLDLEAMEAAAADMEALNVDDVDEDLFADEDSDEDLDDLDFDDSDDDEDDEPEI
mmetsp:Transcript_28431/g.41846  ORF Transcript_28431/g.41846 Transcript_28431/m.41846 type:complete len:293 (-) Transcript_28431:147-1025(-)